MLATDASGWAQLRNVCRTMYVCASKRTLICGSSKRVHVSRPDGAPLQVPLGMPS